MDLMGARRLAVGLVEQHGLDGWTVEFDRAKRRAGVCRHQRRVIGLSAPLTRLHDEAEVRDTILHEIAHALVGPAHRHDAVWQRTAIEIGSSGRRCVDEDAPRVAAPWLGICPTGHTVERHRRPERPTSCSRCSARFSLEHLLEWTFHGRPVRMHPNYVMMLDRLRRGEQTVLLGPGCRVRVLVPPLVGQVGTVVKRARTSYHVRLPEGVYRVVFAGVELLEA
ncbi:MAG: SprT-like domain-containing protein [Nocardioidaceae bacterium]